MPDCWGGLFDQCHDTYTFHNSRKVGVDLTHESEEYLFRPTFGVVADILQARTWFIAATRGKSKQRQFPGYTRTRMRRPPRQLSSVGPTDQRQLQAGILAASSIIFFFVDTSAPRKRIYHTDLARY